MSKLIEDLTKEHALIVDVFKKVKELGVGSKEGKDKLLLAKKGLLGHLKKEDEELYPVLKKAAEADKGLKRTLEVFAQDMGEISKFALDFFEKYSQGESSGVEFAKDFGRLFIVLGGRVRKEEGILYAAYEKLSQA